MLTGTAANLTGASRSNFEMAHEQGFGRKPLQSSGFWQEAQFLITSAFPKGGLGALRTGQRLPEREMLKKKKNKVETIAPCFVVLCFVLF